MKDGRLINLSGSNLKKIALIPDDEKAALLHKMLNRLSQLP